MRRAFVVVGLVLGCLAVVKMVQPYSAPAGGQGLLALLGQSWVRTTFSVAELILAGWIVITRSVLLVRATCLLLGMAAVLHAVDVAYRGSLASGCGCFGDPGSSTAGLDLVRATLLFALFATAASWSWLRSFRAAVLLTALLLAFIASLLFDPTPGSPALEFRVPQVSTEEDAGSGNPILETPELRGGTALSTERVPSPANPTEQGPKVAVRVTAGGVLLEGARIEIQLLGAERVGTSHASGETGETGLWSFEPSAQDFPLAVLVRARAPFVPVARVLDAMPSDVVAFELEQGRALEIRTIDLNGDAMAHVSLVVSAVGAPGRGGAGMYRAESGWVLEDARRVTTDQAGVALVERLDPSRLFRVYAPGFGTPTSWRQPDSMAPGPGKRMVLQLGRLRVVWGRAVGADLAPIRTVTWTVHGTADDPLRSQEKLFPAKYPWSNLGVLGLRQPIGMGETIRLFVSTAPDSETIEFGPMAVSAPGYGAVRQVLPARPVKEAQQGPTLVPMVADADSSFSKLEIKPRTSRSGVRAMIKLKQGKRIVYAKIWDSGVHQTLKFDIAAGDYEFEVGGNHLDPIRVGARPVRREVDLDALPSLRISLTLEEKPFEGPGLVAMYQESGGTLLWNLMTGDVPYSKGQSPRFVVPVGTVVVSGGSMDGRVAGYVSVELGTGEHAKVELAKP